MFELKTYQQNALSALEGFLERCRDEDPAAVYADVARGLGAKNPAYHDIFNGAPCACLKVPTGGGKTIIAASAIKVIDDAYLQTGAPVTLWLTPSEAITAQTLKALQDAAHPYHKAIANKFQSVKVVGVADIATLTDADFGHAAIIVVATIQTFNIEDKKQRNVYAFREDLEAFFKDVPSEKAAKLARVNEDDVKRSEVLRRASGASTVPSRTS